MTVKRIHGMFFDSWRWEVNYRRPKGERVTLRGRKRTKSAAERAARNALVELVWTRHDGKRA